MCTKQRTGISPKLALVMKSRPFFALSPTVNRSIGYQLDSDTVKEDEDTLIALTVILID